MTQGSSHESDKLFLEIDTQNVRMYHITMELLKVMFVAWIVSLVPASSLVYAITVIPILGVAWVWAMVRADFLIHRAGTYLGEAGDSPWETSWPRHFRKWLLVPFDFLSMSAFLFFVVWAETVCWGLPGWGWRLYVWATAILFVAGQVMIGFVATMFAKEAKLRKQEGEQDPSAKLRDWE